MSRRPSDLDPELLRAFRDAVRAKISRDLEAEDAAAAERKQRVRAAVERGLAQARDQGLLGAAWLFGSYAWGQPGERGDVDLLVEGCRGRGAAVSPLDARVAVVAALSAE
jgi:hypothetical protein